MKVKSRGQNKIVPVVSEAMRAMPWYCHQLNWQGKYSIFTPVLPLDQVFSLVPPGTSLKLSYLSTFTALKRACLNWRFWRLWDSMSLLSRNKSHSSHLKGFRTRSKNCRASPKATSCLYGYDWKLHMSSSWLCHVTASEIKKYYTTQQFMSSGENKTRNGNP